MLPASTLSPHLNSTIQTNRIMLFFIPAASWVIIEHNLHVYTEKKVEHRLSFPEFKNQPVSTERNIPISSNSMFQVRQILCQSEVKKWPCNALWYMNKMVPHSENQLQHLAAFILMFLNTSVEFLGSNSNDGALKAENVMHFWVHTPVTPTSARHGLSLCVSTANLHGLTH